MIYPSYSLAKTFLAGDHQRRGGSERHPGGRGGAVGATSSAVGGGATSPAGALVPPGGREVGAWERGPIDDVGWHNVIECNRIYRSSKGLRMQVPQYRNMHFLQRRCHSLEANPSVSVKLTYLVLLFISPEVPLYSRHDCWTSPCSDKPLDSLIQSMFIKWNLQTKLWIPGIYSSKLYVWLQKTSRNLMAGPVAYSFHTFFYC